MFHYIKGKLAMKFKLIADLSAQSLEQKQINVMNSLTICQM